jgi:hypothetical protein
MSPGRLVVHPFRAVLWALRAAKRSVRVSDLRDTIGKRIGIPCDQHLWGWSCGFYPGSHPGGYETGTAATFDEARARFEAAWGRFLPKRTEADFQAWRHDRDWAERKYAMWASGEKLPSQKPSSLMTCPAAKSSTSIG